LASSDHSSCDHTRSARCPRAPARGARLTLATFAVAQLVRAAPLEVYGRLPHLENLALSPDGSRVAFVKTEENTRVVAVVALGKHEVLGGVRAGDQKLRSIGWADNDHLLIVISVTAVPRGFIGDPSEWYQMQVYDLKTGKLFVVPPPGGPFSDAEWMNTIRGHVMVRHIKDRTVLFVPGLQLMREPGRDRLVPALIQVDLQTQHAHLVRPGGLGNLAWIVDDGGQLAAEESYDERGRRWSIFIRREGRMQEAAAGEAQIEFPRLLGWGPTSDTLLLEKLEDGDPVWRLLSLKDGSIGPPMAERKALERPIEDFTTNRMIGGVHVGDSEEYLFFDHGAQESWKAILATFRGERVHLESAAAEFRKIVVRVEGQEDGYRYVLVDLNAQTATPLGDIYEGLTKPLEVRRITYDAADGLKIPAYLTLPRGKPAKSLPLIVLPHGGPAERDTSDFHWWPQALADQGYAVLQPNYRGSTLTRGFMSKGFGEWGRKMQTDLSDGVRYLAKEGIADPGRVCIVGASYGGYAALAGPALDPGVYRCAVAVAGIGDVKRMLAWVNERYGTTQNWAQRYWDRFMGVSGPGDPAVDAISPIRHVNSVTVPVLLIHGKDDTVVPFEQSQVMYDALKGASKDVQLVKLKDEDHWLSRSGTRLQMLQVSVAFLRAHNPPD
jgi:dipeptidyl aminopeptidase/acylaminoacyl peptidase